MTDTGMKKCLFCAEKIREEAIKCRYCGSMVNGEDTSPEIRVSYNSWRRVNEKKKIAGVCTGLAKQFKIPGLLLPLRVAFLFGTIFYGLSIVIYIGLWILMPRPSDEPVVWADTYIPPQKGIKSDTCLSPEREATS